jgi:pimeloyl-ACP methyl ester carboxylesterase
MPPPATVDEVVPFTAGDGLECNLVHVRAEREPSKGPVLLVHGAGVRGNIFRSPVAETFVDALIGAGYDVWLENWRASIELAPNEWTLDQAAVFDHPEAVRTVVRHTGAESIQAVIHCQGSTSFMMSAVAGLVPEVRTIVANAVSLHPVVPAWSAFKLRRLVPLVRLLTPYMDPSWGEHAPSLVAKLIAGTAKLVHRECRNGVCRMVSFTYGAGFPALWSHENLNDETHEWLKREFGPCPLTFFRQMSRCVRRGHLVKASDLPQLPESFVAQEPMTDARVAFFAGEHNRCFLPESQQRSFEFFEGHHPGRSSLHVIGGYGHLDMFMGQNAARDVFPQMLSELETASGRV